MDDIHNPAFSASLISIAAIVWAAACGFQDLWRLRVSNLLTLGMVVLAALALFRGQALLGATVAQALWGLLAGALLTFPGYALGKLGAADVKMMLAMGLAAGIWGMLQAFVVGSFLAAGLMLGLRLLGGYPVVERALSLRLLNNFTPRSGKSFPFVFCLAIGFVSVCLSPWWGH